jgi:hypothetical protein
VNVNGGESASRSLHNVRNAVLSIDESRKTKKQTALKHAVIGFRQEKDKIGRYDLNTDVVLEPGFFHQEVF